MPEPLREPTVFSVPAQSDDPNVTGADRFEPSVATLQAYYGTRKRNEAAKFREGGFKLPGLFDTQNYDSDRRMFTFALFLELAGVIFLGQVLYKASTLSRFSTAAIAALFVVVDLLLAYFHTGVLKPTQNQLENERLRIFPEMRDGASGSRTLREYLDLDAMIVPKWRVWLAMLFGALIMASAFVKAFVFYIHWQDIQLGQTDAVGLPASDRNYAFVISSLIMLSYLAVAAIHYRYTGYYLHGWQQRYNEKKDRRQRASDAAREYCLASARNIALPTMAEFIAATSDPNNRHAEFNRLCPDDEAERSELRRIATPYSPVVTPNRRHRVTQLDGGRYQIVAYGLLRDEDLIRLVTAQPTATAKAAVTLYGHLLQLRTMENARPRDQETEQMRHDVQRGPNAV